MNKLIKICEALNKVLKAVWPYLVALASGAVLAGCAIEHMNLTLHNARTAGMELTETSSTVVETAVEAVQ